MTSSSIVSLTTFAFVIGHSANSTIFTVKSTSLILAIGTTETMRTRAHIVTDANSTIGTMRRARIWKMDNFEFWRQNTLFLHGNEVIQSSGASQHCCRFKAELARKCIFPCIMRLYVTFSPLWFHATEAPFYWMCISTTLEKCDFFLKISSVSSAMK